MNIGGRTRTDAHAPNTHSIIDQRDLGTMAVNNLRLRRRTGAEFVAAESKLRGQPRLPERQLIVRLTRTPGTVDRNGSIISLAVRSRVGQPLDYVRRYEH